MNDREWTAEMRRLLEVRNRTQRAEALLELAEQSRKHAKKAISGWHEQQALGLAAALFEDTGKLDDAARNFERLAKLHRTELVYHGQAIVFALARAALLRFRLGQVKPAKVLAREALKIFGDYPTSNPFIEEVLSEWRERAE